MILNNPVIADADSEVIGGKEFFKSARPGIFAKGVDLIYKPVAEVFVGVCAVPSRRRQKSPDDM